ncbi:VPLPA-CTERM sorting domain-containing protein [Roseitranquillus sediminis]|uniref:VPLPA-CTERM sorting domain-containing protein n=1 Tax=Roseitranquillus sediminis TaxID=2809051 RepID=UPI001D0C31EA|nr:VPLPA-CTERM sorting domain-containing protein [Roseitranquillus sediminis]MBM9594542.1 VPLPA-CTERM sorting domain-containing protein [Roseitranquillus sediminis]
MLPVGAFAAPVTYIGKITELNESGVFGTTTATIDGNMLTVTVDAKSDGTGFGIAPGQVHIQHIHGVIENGQNLDSVPPPNLPDRDNPIFDDDDYVELAEGAPFYGGIRVFLNATNDPNDFATFPDATGGMINFSQRYILTPDQVASISPLNLREYVLHGAFDQPGKTFSIENSLAGVDSEVEGGYLTSLPIATATYEMAPIPLPAAGVLLLGALGGLAGLRRLRK